MDTLTIKHQWTAHSVDIWQAIKGHHVSNDGAHHIQDRRAAGALIMGLSVMTLSIGVACVGLGRAACTSPVDAQVPEGDNRAGSSSGTFEFLNETVDRC